jgi:hypothetical protein
MKTENLKITAETEKAIQFEVGFKFNENAKSVVYGKIGEENLSTGYLVLAWVPKSIIKDNEIPVWFVIKDINPKFGKLNINDIKY